VLGREVRCEILFSFRPDAVMESGVDVRILLSSLVVRQCLWTALLWKPARLAAPREWS